MTNEERAYNYASTRKATKLQVGEIAKFYNDGYEQAEKDLALTWEDIKTIVQILADSDWYDFEINGKLWSKEFYEEVLKRFKEAKK